MAANGISTLQYKRDRQIAKLDLAATQRGETYDLTQLPTVYAVEDNNTNAVVNNLNTGGLIPGRPWAILNFETALQLNLSPYSIDSYPGSGTAIVDLSANAFEGTLINGVGFDGIGLTFDGVDDYVDLNDTVTAENFTVVVWFKCSDVSDNRMIISKEELGGVPWNYRLYIANTTGKLVGDIADESGVGSSVVSDLAYDDNAWHMATFVRNTTLGKLFLYVNGQLIKESTDTTNGPITNTQEIWIGASNYQTLSYPFAGSIGDVVIYDRSLASYEIGSLFDLLKSSYTS